MLIGDVLHELVNQLAVRAVYVSAIEANATGILCGTSVHCHVLCDSSVVSALAI
jgi:hypothetical protein